jgi:hypothetical protein
MIRCYTRVNKLITNVRHIIHTFEVNYELYDIDTVQWTLSNTV